MTHSLRLTLAATAILAATILITLVYRRPQPIPIAHVPQSQPATTPTAASQPTTKPASRPHPTTQLLDILRAQHPTYPTTQPLAEPLDLQDAARILILDPVYLDYQANLWLTRPDAPEPFDFLAAIPRRNTTAAHLLRDKVSFVVWSPDRRNRWLPHLIVHSPTGKGYDLLDATGRRPLPDPHGFDFARALILYSLKHDHDTLIVPTTTGGVCTFSFDDAPDTILRSHHPITPAPPAKPTPIQLAIDLQGVLAWAQADPANPAATGIARYLPPTDDTPATWTHLDQPPASWPARIQHVLPLLDGAALIASIDPEDPDKTRFTTHTLQAVPIDQPRILALIDTLASPDPAKREQALHDLKQYGPAITPLLEQALEDQPPEAQIRIRQLLQNKAAPSLGGLALIDSHLTLLSHTPDGGVVFFAPAGARLPPDIDNFARPITPAYLSIRPGRGVELLPAPLTADLLPDQTRLTPWREEWVVSDPAHPPELFVGNHRQPLLAPAHKAFDLFAGIDATGRWLFRDPKGATLLLDPHLPDPTPRLPAWTLPPSAAKPGWDAKGWPVLYVDAKPNPQPWAFQATGWRALDPKQDTVQTDLPTPTTNPADLLLTTPDQTRYSGGRDFLRIEHPSQTPITWPLPENALGAAEHPALFKTREGLLFLINDPGRVIRLRENHDPANPLTLEAVFSKNIPTAPPTRIWLDPADRLCILQNDRITLLFTQGTIPPEIRQLMPEDPGKPAP